MSCVCSKTGSSNNVLKAQVTSKLVLSGRYARRRFKTHSVITVRIYSRYIECGATHQKNIDNSLNQSKRVIIF
jgi:hypothetical protein